MKSRKTIVVLMIAVMMCSTNTLAQTPSSNPPIVIQPFWTNASEVNPKLSFDGTTATCSAIVKGFSGTTKITATAKLGRKTGTSTYTTVKTWSDLSVNGATLTFSDTYTVTKGYTYRLTISADVTRNGTTESVSNWIEKSC